MTARDIINTIGRERIMAALNVSPFSLEKAAVKGRIPALWFDALERLAGEPLPREAFTFHEIKE